MSLEDLVSCNLMSTSLLVNMNDDDGDGHILFWKSLTTKYIDAMFVHASHGCQCLRNKLQTRWLSDNTDLTPRHLIVLSIPTGNVAGRPRKWYPFSIWVPSPFRCSAFGTFLYSGISFIKFDVVLRLPMWTGYVLRPMRINCNFVATVGLTDDEHCLIHDLRVEKHRRGFERITKIFSNNWAI